MKQILTISFIATSGMTLFSYIMAFIFNKRFQEPELLNSLILPSRIKENRYHPIGFMVHYSVGLFFAYFYYKFFRKRIFKANPLHGAAMGFINGIFGIAGWKLFFLFRYRPPEIKPVAFYFQLLIAHVVFGALNAFTYKYQIQIKQCMKSDSLNQ